MAREWSLSRFVRLYVNESADEAAWDWQARCVWPLLIKAADRAGVIETTKGAKGLAAAIRMPLEVVTPAVDELVADGCLVETARGYILRNYVEAQTAEMAGSLRQAEYKARKRAKAALGDTDCNVGDAEVTRGDTGSREVTRGDAEVTPIRSEPRRAEQSEERESGSGTATPALTLTSQPQGKTRKRPATTLPPDFAPTDAHRAFCATNALDLDREAERFALHHTAKGSTFSSWSAALSTWLHNAVDFGKRAGPANGRAAPTSSIDATAQALRERGFIS